MTCYGVLSQSCFSGCTGRYSNRATVPPLDRVFRQTCVDEKMVQSAIAFPIFYFLFFWNSRFARTSSMPWVYVWMQWNLLCCALTNRSIDFLFCSYVVRYVRSSGMLGHRRHFTAAAVDR